MKKEKLEFTRLVLEDGYYIDMLPSAEENGSIELWLHQKESGCVLFMFGVQGDSLKYIEEIALNNAPEYITIFEKEYECEE